MDVIILVYRCKYRQLPPILFRLLLNYFPATWICQYSRYHWKIFKNPIKSRHKVIVIEKYSYSTLNSPSIVLLYW